MKIALHAPFGSVNREAGLMYLLGNYLRNSMHEIVQLRCNGVFSLCDRDGETSWKRNVDSCIRCACEQKTLARWGDIPQRDLSTFLTSEEVVDTRRWILSTAGDALPTLTLRGVNLYDICRASFKYRFGIETPDMQNRKHEPLMRRIMLSAARMSLAARRFNNLFSPEVLFIAGGEDYITSALAAQAQQQKKDVVIFAMDLNQRCINVLHPREPKKLACHLLLTDITVMRADIKTWPPEVMSEIEAILSFLEIFQAQMTLPLAR